MHCENSFQEAKTIKSALVTKCSYVAAGLPEMFPGDVNIELLDVFFGEGRVLEVLSHEAYWDVLFIDVDLQSSLEMTLLTKLMTLQLDTPVVIISSAYNPRECKVYQRAGAALYLGKHMELADFGSSLNKITPLVDLRILTNEQINENTSRTKKPSGLRSVFSVLSPCEKKVMNLLIQGFSVTKIAELEGKNHRTISSQKISVMKKLNLNKHNMKNPLAVYNKLESLIKSMGESKHK